VVHPETVKILKDMMAGKI